ncbi:unnamed protein product [Schistosoma intercalatum]|nr:unnamed protein product [Schistosoma intercalatum]CAH8481818.1 unnamed protein product [Schistosoma intercalatum]
MCVLTLLILVVLYSVYIWTSNEDNIIESFEMMKVFKIGVIQIIKIVVYLQVLQFVSCQVSDHNEQHGENKELSKFYTKLYKADENKLRSGIDYKLNLQANLENTRKLVDLSTKPLFEFVNEDIFRNRPTFANM